MKKEKIIKEIDYLLKRNDKYYEIENQDIIKNIKEECLKLKKCETQEELKRNLKNITNELKEINESKKERNEERFYLKVIKNTLEESNE